MKPLSIKHLSVLLAGALLLCHGIFGTLHLVCHLPQCADHGEHAAEHQAAAGGPGDAHRHPAVHGSSTAYFAVLAGLLGLFLGLLSKRTPLRVRLGMPWAAALRRASYAFHPPPTSTPPQLQVFRL
jgi:hypothetical protein